MALNFKLKDGGVIRLDDGAHVPDAPDNRDWQEYQRWLADGNTPLPTDPAPVPPTDAEQADTKATSDPVWRAWVSRQAKKEGKTVRQIINELRAELP